MKKFVIITDSTSDVPQHIVEKYNLDYIPMEVNFGPEVLKQYLDERDFKLADFFARLDNKERAQTSLINMQTFITKFTPYLEEGYDIIFIGLSSGLSSSFGQAILAKGELEADFPARSIHLIDSKGGSLAEGLLVIEALELQAKGASFEEVIAHVEALVPHVVALFVPVNLETLRRGGRVSAVKAVLGDVLNIKPILHINDEGKLVQLSKARGFKNALRTLVDLAAERLSGPYDRKFYVVHANNLENANLMVELFSEKASGAIPEINSIGPVISAHTGTGVIALIFIGTHR